MWPADSYVIHSPGLSDLLFDIKLNRLNIDFVQDEFKYLNQECNFIKVAKIKMCYFIKLGIILSMHTPKASVTIIFCWDTIFSPPSLNWTIW